MIRHFDQIKNYDNEIPWYIRDYLVKHKIQLMIPWIRKMFGEDKKTIKILDAGCGTGHHIKELYKQGYLNIYGIDSSIKQIEKAKHHNSAIKSNIKTGDIKSTQFPSESFDVVYAINVLHHFKNKNLQIDGARELIRITKAGGLILVHEMNINNPFILVYLNFIFPKIKNIDEGKEIWLKPSFFRQFQELKILNLKFYNFVPDFTPKFLFKIIEKIGDLLEKSFVAKWSASYLIAMRKYK